MNMQYDTSQSRLIHWGLIAALLLATVAALGAGVSLPAVFSDHMVLQRDCRTPVWGWADPGERVTVTLGDERKTGVAGADGRWQVRLAPHPAGGPFVLNIAGKADTRTLQDVYFGEVWLCSGQSNMQMLLGKSARSWIAGGVTDYEQEIADADYPQIRMLTVPFDDQTMVLEPKRDSGGTWIACSPQTAGNFAAIPFFFGRDLHRRLHVPIGLLNVTLGGSCVEAWISGPTARREACMQPALAAWEAIWAAYQQHAADTPPPAKPFDHRSTPSVLFNGMLAPFVPYAMKGVIWYQGEQNADKPQDYAARFQALIRDWRRQWRADFPFLFVQLAPIGGENFSRLRDAQRQALATPNTAMAVSVDLDTGLHPRNKRPVGERLALAARALAYGEKIEYSGPLADKASCVNSTVRVRFSHTGSGLALSAGAAPVSFTLAGADGVFLPAEARIAGDFIEVSCAKVPHPTAVRYGWVDGPVRNLINREGLPASPFELEITGTK